MQTFLSDLRLAFRMLAKKPGFTAVAVLTLALGIAINASMFSMVSAFLLRRPPVRDPERIVVVSSVSPNPRFHADAVPVSPPNYLAWREANHGFAETAAADEYRRVNLTQSLSGGEGSSVTEGATADPEVLPSAAVSPHYFNVLGVSAQFGRTFLDEEDQPGRDRVVILGHDVWERRFGSDPAIVGRTIRLNREDYVVVGVMPANFRLMSFIPQLWTPLVLNPAEQTAAARKGHSLRFFGRLKPGVTRSALCVHQLGVAHQSSLRSPSTMMSFPISPFREAGSLINQPVTFAP